MSEYQADDREPGDFPTNPTWSTAVDQPGRYNEMVGGRMTTAALAAAWRERDAQYAIAPKYLTDQQIEVIRSFRMSEVNDLPMEDRAKAGMAVLSWYPPEHAQGRR